MNLLQRIPTTVSTAKPVEVRWWQAGLFLLGVSVLGRLSIGSRRQQIAGYDADEKPRWAPPRPVFGPVWGVNSAALTYSGYRLLGASANYPHRQALLRLQGLHWLNFTTFGLVYFRLKSPVLGLVWTQADALIAVSSLYLARRGDPRVALGYAPLTLWTCYASGVSWSQALHNPDDFLGTNAPLDNNTPSRTILTNDL